MSWQNVSIRNRRKQQVYKRAPRIQRGLFKRMGLEHAALGLKTKGRRNYASVFREEQKTKAE